MNKLKPSLVQRAFTLGQRECETRGTGDDEQIPLELTNLERELSALLKEEVKSERLSKALAALPSAKTDTQWVWWNKTEGGIAVGPRNKGCQAIVFTIKEAQAICQAINQCAA